MSGRKWKPGDVVTGLLDGNQVHGIITQGGTRVYQADSAGNALVDVGDLLGIRPLVVIDPEDREQVRALRSAVENSNETFLEKWQAALRSLIADPKPDEPTGWGAVVEDDTGAYWTLYAPHSRVWINYVEGKRQYDGITVVRVLSQGVTP